jgi:hypothetical protein
VCHVEREGLIGMCHTEREGLIGGYLVADLQFVQQTSHMGVGDGLNGIRLLGVKG